MAFNLLLLSLLLCVFGSIGITAEIESNSASLAEKMQLTDLNIDVLHLIFDEFDLERLINMKRTSKRLESFTDAFFCHKFPNCSVALNYRGSKYAIHGSYIELRENAFILEFLQHFGSFIHSISFNNLKSKEILRNITWPLESVETFICYIDVRFPFHDIESKI